MEVLRRAKGLVRIAYETTQRLPGDERFGLSSQLRRAAVSIAANIAEGLGRGTQGDFERFLRIAAGSAAEVEVLLELARDLHQLDTSEAESAVDSVRRQLNRLICRVHAERR